MTRSVGLAAFVALATLLLVGCYCPYCIHEVTVDKQVNPNEKWAYGGLKPPGAWRAPAGGLGAQWEIESGNYEVWGWVMPETWPEGRPYPNRLQVYVDRLKDKVSETNSGAGSVVVTLKMDPTTGVSLPDQYVQVPKTIVIDPAKNEYVRGQIRPSGAPLYKGAGLKLAFSSRHGDQAMVRAAGGGAAQWALSRRSDLRGIPGVFNGSVLFEKALAKAILTQVLGSCITLFPSELIIERMVYIFNLALYLPSHASHGGQIGGATYPKKIVIVLECLPAPSSAALGPKALKKLTISLPIDPKTGEAIEVQRNVADDFAVNFSAGERLSISMKPMGADIPEGASMWITARPAEQLVKPPFELFSMR